MRELNQGISIETVTGVLRLAPLFKGLDEAMLRRVASAGALLQYDPGEALIEAGAPNDGLYVVLRGDARVMVPNPRGDDYTTVGKLTGGECFGEIGVLLNQPRTATVVAVGGPVVAMRFAPNIVEEMFRKIPEFGITVARALAVRTHVVPEAAQPSDLSVEQVSPDTVALLPMEFVIRWRVVPMRVSDGELLLGHVDAIDASTLRRCQQFIPGLTLRPIRIDAALFNQAIARREDRLGVSGRYDAIPDPTKVKVAGMNLEALLRRMAARGASDMHLAAGHRPRVRVDGAIEEVEGAQVVEGDDVLELMGPTLEQAHKDEFARTNDLDYGWSLQGVARFRINLYRTHRGVCAAIRQIAARVLTAAELGLPQPVVDFCELPNGLVLVTGPTGSGKSTTLAAMVDHINRNRSVHVLTLEDPIEFVHESKRALVSQREVGPHTGSFARALRAALREDPDVILVGEMRDHETIALALETANTGHLVLGTLHTRTAVGTIDRIVNVFPADQQEQVRSTLADCLGGVVAQTLCRRVGGGRVAALDVLVCSAATRNMVRRNETHKIASEMQTGFGRGNRILNHELAALVQRGEVTAEEALKKTNDRAELEARLKVRPT